MFALAAVCGLAYVIFRVILPRLQFGQNNGGMIRIVERVGVDSKRSLLVVEVTGKWFVVGISESGVQLVSELDETSATQAEEKIILNREAQLKKIEDFRVGFATKAANLVGRKGAQKNVGDEPEKKKQFDWIVKK